jgi:hypothetical protein
MPLDLESDDLACFILDLGTDGPMVSDLTATGARLDFGVLLGIMPIDHFASFLPHLPRSLHTAASFRIRTLPHLEQILILHLPGSV